jgi:exopolysaccharide biosynthesis polyprenyl glycosylphosphotransferase
MTLVWTAAGRWAAQSFRAMPFAVGSFALAATASATGLVALSTVSFWHPDFALTQLGLAVAAGATFLGAGVWDAVARAARPARRVLVVGGGEATARLLDDLALDPQAGLRVVGVVDDAVADSLRGSPLHLGALDDLTRMVRRVSPDLVVVAVQTGRPEIFTQLLDVADAGFQVMGMPEVYEFAFGRLPVENLTSAWFMSVLHAYNRPRSRMVKRAFDVAVAAVGLVATLPLLPVIAVIVKSTSGPLLYRQTRLGEHGKPFTILKFRSMRNDAEAAGAPQWAEEEDPRVIRGGRMLRRFRLDELPQLWNVLRGEMSIVGPRPERPEFMEQLESGVPFWAHRHLLKPGITGWAQIRAGYAADELGANEKLSYDLWYLRHHTTMLDLLICLKTLPRMATRGGAR